MTDIQTVYRPLVSARSRRLRVIGILLLISVLGMTLYGYFVLMPSLRALPHIAPPVDRNSATTPSARVQGHSTVGTGIVEANASSSEYKLSERARKTALAKVIFVYGYWSVCGVLIIALLLVCWLDFRELTRAYEDQRQRLYFNSLAAQSEEPDSKEA